MMVFLSLASASASTAIISSNIHCTARRSSSSSSSDSNSNTRRRGFGTPTTKKIHMQSNSTTSKEEKSPTIQIELQKRNRNSNSSLAQPTQAPGLNSPKDGSYKSTSIDLEFEERLKAISRSAVEQKKANEMKEFGAIDYDAPNEIEEKTIGFGTKIGVGVAVVVFGLVFALGDFLPSGSDIPSEDAVVSQKRLSDEERSILQTRLKQFEAGLSSSPKDPTSLEGAAITLAELGEYKTAASRLEELVKEKPEDPDVFRLLGEVKFELKDYEGSAAAYRSSVKVSKGINFEVLRGLTNSLLAAKRSDEAVQVLLASCNQLKSKKSDIKPENGSSETDLKVDPIQVDLLLGKAYSDWGHISDAASVYDGVISSNPDDFRGYLAKGILLKENGNAGDAERMFIQARFFAPEKAKALVDLYSRR